MTNAGATAPDPWTVASIAVVVYCLSNVAHEGIGHGGACLLWAASPFCSTPHSCLWSHRAERDAGHHGRGGMLNLALVLVAGLGLRLWRGRPGAAHYFFWLLLAVNFLMPLATSASQASAALATGRSS